MFRSKLFMEAFAIIVILTAIFAGAMYFISVPVINKTVNELEENAAKTALDSVYYMVEKAYINLEAEKQSLTESRKSTAKALEEKIQNKKEKEIMQLRQFIKELKIGKTTTLPILPGWWCIWWKAGLFAIWPDP